MLTYRPSVSLPVLQCSCATVEGPRSPAVHTCRCLSSKDSTMSLLHLLLLASSYYGKDPESNYADGTMRCKVANRWRHTWWTTMTSSLAFGNIYRSIQEQTGSSDPQTSRLISNLELSNYQIPWKMKRKLNCPVPLPQLLLLWYFLFSFQHGVTLWWRLKNPPKHVGQKIKTLK